MFAYVPARGGSKRIPRKNLLPLGGKPLLSHVLDALSAVEGLRGVAVSSDDEEILAVARRNARVVTLEPRERLLAKDGATLVDLALRDVPRFAQHFGDRSVLFVLPTAALVPSDVYRKAVDLHRQAGAGLILSVTGYNTAPWLALTGNPQNGLAPLFPERYLQPTKDLPTCYADAGCFYVFDVDGIQGKTKFLDLQPVRGVVIDASVGIDLDTPDDWLRLVSSYEARQGRGVTGSPDEALAENRRGDNFRFAPTRAR